MLLLPLTNVGLALLFAFLPQFDSRMKGHGPETQASQKQVRRILSLSTGVLMASMALLIDAVALGYKLDVLRIVTLGMLILFAVMGNYFPKLRPNRFVGIRTPWTLKSPEVWMRTHRLFGAIMLIGSLALMLPCLLLPSTYAIWLFLGFVLFFTLGSMVL